MHDPVKERDQDRGVSWESAMRQSLARGVGIVVIGFLVALITISSMQVFWRYVLQHSLSWSEELARFLFVWVVALGVALAFQKGYHVAIDLFLNRLSGGPRRILQWIGRFTVMGIWLLVAIAALQLLPVVNLQRSPALGLPMGLPYLSVLAGTVITLAFLVLDAIGEIRSGKKPLAAEPQEKEPI